MLSGGDACGARRRPGAGPRAGPREPDGRIDALDGLRGVAAVVVVLAHTFNAFYVDPSLRVSIARSPAALLLCSAGAVQLFFVLSGAVLAASLARTPSGWGGTLGFLGKRVLRIHPPYVAALLLAWGASLFYLAPPAELAQGLGPAMARVHLTPLQLGQALLFPGSAGHQLPVGWTLSVEMGFSLVMPFLVWAAARTHWSVLLAISVALLFGLEGGHPLRYGVDFVLGIALYRERTRIGAFLDRVGSLGRGAWVGLGLALCALPYAFGSSLVREVVVTPATAPNVLVLGLGSALLVAGAVHVAALRRVLTRGPMGWLGRLSFGLYLVHYTVILLLSPWIPRPTDLLGGAMALAAVMAVSLVLAAALHHAVERPSIRAGRRWAERVADLRPARTLLAR